MLRFGLVARETKTSRESEVIEMMDYIPEKEPREIPTSRLNEPCANEIVGNGLPGCFHPGDFGEKPQKPKRTLIDTVKTNSDLIIECCGIARRINTFIFASVDENMNVNKPNPNCFMDEIECQRIDLRTLHTLLMQIMKELGA